MKNLKHLIAYLIVILITFFITRQYFCELPTPTDKEECVISECGDPCDTPSAVIPLNDVKRLYSGYINLTDSISQRDVIEGKELDEVNQLLKTRGVWFNYEEFKKYLSYIDQSAKNADIEITGLRFFPSISFSKEEKIGQLNLFYNPTYKVREGNELVDLAYLLVKQDDRTIAVPLRDSLTANIRRYNQAQNQKQEISTGSFSSLFSGSNTVFQEIISQAGNGGQQSPPPHE